jgi:hypothetical protein
VQALAQTYRASKNAFTAPVMVAKISSVISECIGKENTEAQRDSVTGNFPPFQKGANAG